MFPIDYSALNSTDEERETYRYSTVQYSTVQYSTERSYIKSYLNYLQLFYLQIHFNQYIFQSCQTRGEGKPEECYGLAILWFYY